MGMIVRHIEQQTLINEVIQPLEHVSMMPFKWFSDNQMKANKGTCYFLVYKKDEVVLRVRDREIKNKNY